MPTFISHLKVLNWAMLIAGFKAPKTTNAVALFLYKIYSALQRNTFHLNFISLLLHLPYNDNKNILAKNIAFAIAYALLEVAIPLITDKAIMDMLNHILEKEDFIIQNSNAEVKKIYFSYTKYTFQMCSILVGTTLFFATSFTFSWISLISKGVSDNLMFPVHLPFKLLKPFWSGFVYSVVQAINGGVFFCFTNILIITLLIYAVLWLKILQHFIVNFSKYAKQYSLTMNMSLEQSRFLLLRSCILEHKRIIKYVTILGDAFFTVYYFRYVNFMNEWTAIFLLIFFSSTSFQLGSLLLQMTDIEVQHKSSFNIIGFSTYGFLL